MSRWHESGCKQPNITVLDDVPCCTHCFALAVAEPNASNIIFDGIPVQAIATKESNANDVHDFQDEKLAPRSKAGLFSKIDHQEQIRLLRINGRQQSATIHASVEAVSMRDPLRLLYDVVSYARFRGSVDKVEWHQIYVGPYWDVVFIPKAYEVQLQAVRHEDTDRVIWMECLCVDHSNIDEKNCQTMLMPRILQEASKTLMCLVPTTDSDDKILNLLKNSVAEATVTADSSLQPHRKPLKSFLQHDYFTTVQAIREVVLGKQLVMVYRQGEFFWTEQIANRITSECSSLQWLRGRSYRHNHGPKDLLQLLCIISSYYCSDNRDKIYAILALFYMEGVAVDYRANITELFAEVAAHLIRQGLFHETLTIASFQTKALELSSWVPDWSIPVDISHISRLELQDNEETDRDDEIWVETTSIEFDVTHDFNLDVSFDIRIGQLSINVMRLCAATGKTFKTGKHPKIIIDKGSLGILAIECLIENYEVGDDFVFYLPGTKDPFILRQNSDHGLFSIVCRCRIRKGLPLNGRDWLEPFEDFSNGETTTRMIPPSPIENRLIQEFAAHLGETSRMHNLSTEDLSLSLTNADQAHALILNFALLFSSGFPRLEAGLADRWMRLDADLRWMFLDQQALMALIQEIESGHHGIVSGRDRISVSDVGSIELLGGRGADFPLSYEWDLRRFCYSHMRTATSAPSTSGSQQTPLLLLLRSRLHEVREWAEVSAQLLRLFELSGSVFEKSWPNFPGLSLAERWSESSAAISNGTGLKYQWDWSDFENVLQVRALIWNQPMPQQLRIHQNKNLTARLSLHCLGLNVSQMEHVTII